MASRGVANQSKNIWYVFENGQQQHKVNTICSYWTKTHPCTPVNKYKGAILGSVNHLCNDEWVLIKLE